MWALAAVVLPLGSLSSALSWKLPEISDYNDHPCRRECMGSFPLVCEYNFTIEHYQTLSRACYNCPHNMSDCDRPHCVPADGFLRAIKVVNRMMPGPALHVCRGDTIVVNVYNHMADFEGTAIHWHGILQEGTPHMDGVAMVTQCPIPVHSAFQYRFQAQNAGTHYWHAHAGLQRGDGVFGALIVRDTSVTSAKSLYDEDLPEHTVFFQDWLDQYSSSKFSLHHHGMNDNTPTSILVNGRGTQFGFSPNDGMEHEMHGMDDTDEMDGGHDMTEMETTTTTTLMTHGNHENHVSMAETTMSSMQGHNMESDKSTTQKAFVPHSVFRVRRGRRYRFRFISNGILNCPLKVSVEKHTLTVIASDGNDILPTEVESLTIFAGERYDVVLIANQYVGNYWMHVIGLGDCEHKNVSETAIIRYEGAMNMHPSTGKTYADGDRKGKNGNPLKFEEDIVTVAGMTSESGADDVYTAHDVRKFYMKLGYNQVENYHFLDSTHYPLSAMYEMHKGSHGNHLFALQMNDITFRMPVSPVLSQYGDLDEGIFCNETSAPTSCQKDFCECVHRIKVELGAVVELVLVSEGFHGHGNHPMHLHGHSFYVLGMEKLNTTVSRSTVEELDRRGKLRRNLRNPIKKDTVMVPDGGYTIIRFHAKNPGFWLFHCHVDFHLALGMSTVIQVGEIHEMRATPGNFPRCGSWHYTENSSPYDMCSLLRNSANNNFENLISTVIVLMTSLLSLWL